MLANIIGNTIGRRRAGGWTGYWVNQPEVLFFGLYSEIEDGKMPNKKAGATDYLTVSGSAGSETYQCPNTAPYIAADTDYIWFQADETQRIVTTAELIGYDLQKTPVKYLDDSPNSIEAIMILSSSVTGTKRDKLFTDMWLPVLWDNSLNAYGHVKSNRVTQSLWYEMILTSTGTGAGVTILKMQVSADITITLDGTAKFYSDSGGTADESATWSLTAGALRTIYLKCPSAAASMKFSDITKVTKWGDVSVDGWTSGMNAASITFAVNLINNLTHLRISGLSNIIGNLPTSIKYLGLISTSVTWTYSGAFHDGLEYLNFNSASVAWTYSGVFPNTLTAILISGALIDWTGLDIGSGSNISTLNLINYRIDKMSSADMVTFLTNLKNRVGNLPATITINEYADSASPSQAVVDAVAALKLAKGITTINLGA